MKGLLKIGTGLILLISTATALANYSNPPRYKDHALFKDNTPSYSDWTGFYAGANVGYGWGAQPVDLSSAPGSALAAAIGANAIPPTIANRPGGNVGGVQAGYNYQYHRTVMGVEADFQLTDITHDQTKVTSVVGFPAFRTDVQQRLQSLGSLRLRLGLAPIDSLLLYLSGGLAYGHGELTGTITNPGCVSFCGNNSTSYNSGGWIGGAGVEYVFTDNWSAKAEYLYYSLAGQSQRILDASMPGTFIAEKVNFEGNFVRIGVNYKFL